MGEWRIKREEPAPPTRCPKCGSKDIFTWRKDDGVFVQCRACGQSFDMERAKTDLLCTCGHPKSKHPVGYNEGCLRVGCGCNKFEEMRQKDG
jgi:DNA-directed RNA polymerase subunit RPC12/RpoP